MKKHGKQFSYFEPRILDYPDDPTHSPWDVAGDPDDFPDGGFKTTEEALEFGANHCSEMDIEMECLVVAEVTTRYFLPSKKELKQFECEEVEDE